MSDRTRQPTGPLRNKAQEEHGAADSETKVFTDTPDIPEETWANPSGHSGTRHAWAISLGMVASFLLAAGGFTFGPRVLLWIGIGLFVALGVYGFARSAWTDYVRDPKQESSSKQESNSKQGSKQESEQEHLLR